MLEIIGNLTWDDVNQYLIDQVVNNQFASAAGLAGLAALIWNYTRKYPEYIWSRIKRKITYTVNVYQTDIFFDYLERYLRDHRSKSYRNVEVNTFWRSDKQYYNYKQFEDLFFIWKRLRLVKVLKNREKLENANSLSTLFMNSYAITGIFAKGPINKFIQEVFDYEISRRVEEYDPTVHIYTNDSHSWVKHHNVVPKDLDKIILEGKEAILEDVNNFLSSRDWYNNRGIPYKRGYMLYGSPGNGKTTLCMSMSKYLERDLYMLTPNRMTDDDDLMSLFRDLSPRSVLLIEDIDAVYGSDRKSGSEEVRFSFSTLLNCLDGALSKEDIIVIFTTNHPENLDPALIREGRIDYKMEVSNPSKKSIEAYLNMFYGVSNTEINDLEVNENLSMVEVQNICLRNRGRLAVAVEEINNKIQVKNGTQK